MADTPRLVLLGKQVWELVIAQVLGRCLKSGFHQRQILLPTAGLQIGAQSHEHKQIGVQSDGTLLHPSFGVQQIVPSPSPRICVSHQPVASLPGQCKPRGIGHKVLIHTGKQPSLARV